MKVRILHWHGFDQSPVDPCDAERQIIARF